MILPLPFLRNVFATLLVVAVLLVSYSAAWLLTDVRRYIALRAVEVPSFEVGTDPVILVSRDVLRAFDGEYEVSIRRQPSNLIAYSTGHVEIPYRPTTEPIEGQTLGWWAHDGSGPVEPIPLPPGAYIMETCHWVNPWYLMRPKARCVISNIFEVTEPTR